MKSTKPANKALLFMLVGLSKKWKQPVAYYFTNNGCSSVQLKECLYEVLHASHHVAKVDVVATICDMGVCNVKCLKDLGVTTERPYFVLEEHQIFCMFDPPHLLKCIYSLFRKHNIFVSVGQNNEVMEARFSDLKLAYEHDKKCPHQFRTMHKIKEDHMQPIMQYSMKVCIAAQVMSHTMAAYLYSLTSTGILEQRAVATATFLEDVDRLFDSFNGSSSFGPPRKELKCCISESSNHLEYWTKAFHMVKNWRFIRMKKDGFLKDSKPPSQIGWLTSINAIKGIWQKVQKKGLTTLGPRSLQQDCLENCFGSIRNGCGCSDNPSAQQFICSLKTQILNGLTNRAVTTNCEEDDYAILSNLNSFLNIKEAKNNTQATENVQLEVIISSIAEDVANGNPHAFSVAYVAGFILKRLSSNMKKCQICSTELYSNNLDPQNMFITMKEWTDVEQRLTYPSQSVTIAVGEAVNLLEIFLSDFASELNISKKCYTALQSKINFEWLTCTVHNELIISIIIKAVIKIGLPWWCKRQNREIKTAKKEKRKNRRKLNKLQNN